MSEFRKALPPSGQIIAFEAAARLSSFTRAGEDLGLSQAAISRQIRELEARLGVKLFQRNRHDVSLTDAGGKFLGGIRPALNMLLSAVEEAQAAGRPETEFIVYSDQSIDSSYLLPRLRRFLEPYPDTELNLISSGKPVEQVQTKFHIAFQAGPVWSTDYDTCAIADDQLFPVCSPAFLAENPQINEPAGLLNTQLLHFEQPGRSWPGWHEYLTWLGCEVPPMRPQFKITRYPTLLHAAETGSGVALGGAISVASRLASGTLVRVETGDLELKDYLHSYMRKGQSKHPFALRFLKWLQQNP